MKSQSGSIGKALFFFNVGCFIPGRNTRYPLYRKLRGPQGRVLTGVEYLALTGIRSPDWPTRSDSLYLLRYPNPYSWNRTLIIDFSFKYSLNFHMGFHVWAPLPPFTCPHSNAGRSYQNNLKISVICVYNYRSLRVWLSRHEFTELGILFGGVGVVFWCTQKL
jgi:hypothetical protein